MRTRIRLASLALCALLFGATSLHAEAIMIAWDANTDPNLSGYIVEYGTSSAPFSIRVVLGTQTTWTLTGAAAATTYWFRVRAYNSNGLQSDPSAAVSWTTAAGPGGCTTPDPFAGMGGGTCYNGGWLPPGMSPPTSTPPPPPAPAPTSSGSCTTPDPFAAMGGGTCYNGGWLPPGVSPPSSAPASTPPPPPPPPPPSTPPPTGTSSGCTTPDPFISMGGGTCFNGGWLPPGDPIPGTTPPPSTPPPSTPPPPAPAPTGSGGCTTPNPFASMGGGTCYNGGWLAPGMTPPSGGTSTPPPPPPQPTAQTGCSTANPFTGMSAVIGMCYNGGWYAAPVQTGTVRSISGKWMIVGDNGVTYQPTTTLALTFQKSGLAVVFAGVPLVTQNGVTVINLATIAAR